MASGAGCRRLDGTGRGASEEAGAVTLVARRAGSSIRLSKTKGAGSLTAAWGGGGGGDRVGLRAVGHHIIGGGVCGPAGCEAGADAGFAVCGGWGWLAFRSIRDCFMSAMAVRKERSSWARCL